MRKTGIDIVGDVPWGTHLCQFYKTREDLIDILVPYFKAGLKNNEFCMWVCSEPLDVEGAKRALKKAVKNLGEYFKKGQIEILDASPEYRKSGKFEPDKVLQGWVKKENQAIKRGFDGLRLTGNTFWVEKRDWADFANYEAVVNNVIGNYRMIAICSYSLVKCCASEVIDVASTHQSALIRREGKWESIESTERRQAEEALRQSEKKYRQLIENANEGIWVIDAEAKTTFVNPRMAEILGSTIDEMLGSSLFSFMDERGVALANRYLERRKQGIKERHDFEFLRKDGTRVYTSLGTTPITDDDGNYMGAIAFVSDITERKWAEKELQVSEEKYRSLYESNKDGISFCDMEGNLLHANQAYLDMFGYTQEEIKRMTYHQLTPEKWHEMEADIVKNQVLARGYSDEFEKEYIKKDGTVFPITIRTWLIKDEQGKPTAMWVIVRDITERRRAEERLREYEARYSHLLDHMPDGVALTRHRKIVRVNPAMAQMFRYPSPESMEGLFLWDLTSPASKEIMRRQSTTRVLGLLGKNRFEFQALRNNEPSFSAECTLTVDRSEAKPFVLAIIRDVTERKTYEEQRKLLSERFLMAQERERALIARELHDELGQALTGIKIDMAWIKSHMKGAGEAISDRFAALGKLVDTTIKSVQTIAGSLRPSVLDRLGLTAAIEWYAGEFERRTGIECIIESESSDFNIGSNTAINVYRIFQEALTNVARHARASRVDVRMAQDRGCLTICISDNGRGIPSQKLSGLMSLGIAGMRERTELAKGRIDIQSRRGKGTKITVHLPSSL